MRIVGIEISEASVEHVQTIDLWYSERSRKWIIERLNANGDRVGVAQACASRQDAEACLAEWLRWHGETHLLSPDEAKRRRQAVRQARRAA